MLSATQSITSSKMLSDYLWWIDPPLPCSFSVTGVTPQGTWTLTCGPLWRRGIYCLHFCMLSTWHSASHGRAAQWVLVNGRICGVRQDGSKLQRPMKVSPWKAWGRPAVCIHTHSKSLGDHCDICTRKRHACVDAASLCCTGGRM